jgi:ATP-dependent protease ClpP protease subunit
MKWVLVFCAGLFLVSCVSAPVTPTKPQEFVLRIDSEKPVEVIQGNDEISRSMSVQNIDGELSMLTFVAQDRSAAYLKLFSGLSVSDVTRFWNDVTWLRINTDVREVVLYINSPGGDAFSGLALADEIERAQRHGFKIIAHASGIIASAAVPVFAVCDERLATPGTIFMVHEASLWKWPGRETASDIRSQGELMHLLRERYLAKLVANSNLTVSEWEAMEVKTTWFSAKQALDWGLADKIE